MENLHFEMAFDVGCLSLSDSPLQVEVARVLSYGATWAVSYRTGIRVRGALLGLLFKRLLSIRSLGKKTSAEVSLATPEPFNYPLLL